MEDINDEIVAVEKERLATQEKLTDLLKLKSKTNTEDEELDRHIEKLERRVKVLTEQLNTLYDTAVELARAAACDLFPDSYYNEYDLD